MKKFKIMLQGIFKKISNFYESDLRWKLIKLTKYSHIPFYPDFFARTGVKGLYSRMIIHFLFKEQIKQIKKNINKEFFNYDNNNVNFLISSPSSGSNYVRNILQSYFELLYQIGNGVPKYDNANARFFFSGSQLDSSALYNHVNVLTNTADKNILIDKKIYKEKKIVFSRYPEGRMDLYKLHQVKPVILYRDPFEEISSVYVKFDRRTPEIRLKEVNLELLTARIKRYKKYINFWAKFVSDPENKDKFLLMNYENIRKNSEVAFEKILSFYNYKIVDEFVKKSVFIHSKENTKTNLWSTNIKHYKKNTRFVDPEIKKIHQKLIKESFDKLLSETNIIKDYNYLKNFN